LPEEEEEEEEEEEDGIEEEEEVINGVVEAILALELMPAPLPWTLPLPVLFRLDLIVLLLLLCCFSGWIV
jgi:hypothetical protein